MSSAQSINNLGRSMGKIIKLFYNKSGQINREQVNVACGYLNSGGIIAVPTDTIYGLVAKVSDSIALNKIYKIKGRDKKKPLAVCLGDIEEVEEAADTQILDRRILGCLLPGPVTILLPRVGKLNKDLNPGVDKIGVRIPDHNFIRQLCREVGPLALTSANRSGDLSPVSVDDFTDLWSDLDCVFDNGLLRSFIDVNGDFRDQRLGSTVLDLSKKGTYSIVREGCGFHRTTSLLNRFGYKKN